MYLCICKHLRSYRISKINNLENWNSYFPHLLSLIQADGATLGHWPQFGAKAQGLVIPFDPVPKFPNTSRRVLIQTEKHRHGPTWRRRPRSPPTRHRFLPPAVLLAHVNNTPSLSVACLDPIEPDHTRLSCISTYQIRAFIIRQSHSPGLLARITSHLFTSLISIFSTV